MSKINKNQQKPQPTLLVNGSFIHFSGFTVEGLVENNGDNNHFEKIKIQKKK